MFSLRGAGLRYGNSQVLDNVSADFSRGSMITITGPNGAGKSTLLGLMMGLRPRHEGEVSLDGKPIEKWSRPELAKKAGFVPQLIRIDFPFTCEQVVLMGRTPHAERLFETDEDLAATERAMTLTDTRQFRCRDFRSLSGGERQRVILASTLAQEPEALLLDEPTTFLDLKHQIAIYQILKDLSQQGLLVLAVTHDLALAAAYSDRVLVLSNGRVAADGPPAEALNTETIERVFEVAPDMMRRLYGR